MKIKKERLQSPEWTAAIVTFVFGVAVHLFGLVNTLHNHDDINNQPYGFGTGVESGRWLLSVLGKTAQKVTGNYDLTLLNGVIFIAFVAIAAGFLTAAFQLKSRKLGVLVGMAFVVFPTATCTMLFRYTAPYYGLAILFAILAVWVIHKVKFGFIISSVLTALALGIYQAYLPITASLFVLLLLKQTLEADLSFWKMVKRGINYCATMIVGLVLYYVALQVFLRYYDAALNDYQGISDMGNLSLQEIPALILTTVKAFANLVTDDYCTLAQTDILKLCYLCVYAAFAAMIVFALIGKKRSLGTIASVVLLCAVLPIAGNLIVLMCPNSDIRTLMVYSVVIILCAPLLLLEAMPAAGEKGMKVVASLRKGVIVVLLTAILSYSYLTQVNYTAQYYANRQVENYMNALVVQVRMTEGFDTQKEWAFIGYIKDPLFENRWQYMDVYSDNKNSKYLLNSYSRLSWLKHYFGYTVPVAGNDRIAQLQEMEEVQNMPCWPNEGSIKIIDNTIVIKFE